MGKERFLHAFRSGFSTIAQLVVTIVAHKYVAVVGQSARFMVKNVFIVKWFILAEIGISVPVV